MKSTRSVHWVTLTADLKAFFPSDSKYLTGFIGTIRFKHELLTPIIRN